MPTTLWLMLVLAGPLGLTSFRFHRFAVAGTITSFYEGDPQAPMALACGGRLHDNRRVCAHRQLPCGTKVSIFLPNDGNHHVSECTIGDRGPWGVETVGFPKRYRIASASLMLSCSRGLRCQPPRGWRWRSELDAPPVTFRDLGVSWHRGRFRAWIWAQGTLAAPPGTEGDLRAPIDGPVSPLP